MADLPRSHHVREAVGVFTDAQELEAVVSELLTAGFDHGDISLLASDDTARAKLHRSYPTIRSAEDDPNSPRVAWVEPETRTEGRGALASVMGYVGAVTAGGIVFATGGAAAVVIAAGVIAGGAMAGAGIALGKALDQTIAGRLHEQLEKGGILLWVRTDGPAQEARAQEILLRHGGHDVHVHDLRA